MIFFWGFGDVIKMVFLFFNDQPIQLFLATSFMVVVEVLIMVQFLLYPSKEEKVPAVEHPSESSSTQPGQDRIAMTAE